MEHNMILSASGWRKIFAKNEQSFSGKIGLKNEILCFLAAKSFFEFLLQKKSNTFPRIVVASDTRPTRIAILRAILKALKECGANVKFLGVAAAPEIMAYSKNADGFIYVSASHNPAGHNGIKFGMENGGVLSAKQNEELKKIFLKKIESILDKKNFFSDCAQFDFADFFEMQKIEKALALKKYEDFLEEIISGISSADLKKKFFSKFDALLKKNKIGIACDFNGSARTLSVDKNFFKKHFVRFYPINDAPFYITHEIIPEGKNLNELVFYIEKIQKYGGNVAFGYACDCDGDRGNIVYWSKKEKRAKILEAQEVFSLAVLAELAYSIWLNGEGQNLAVVVNCATSMRIEKIANVFGAKVFRAEVGEANVVCLAKKLVAQGYTIRVLGEGSNGGVIVFPGNVRDPLCTVFALLKLLCIKDVRGAGGKTKKGLFHFWCEKLDIPYKKNFCLDDIIETLPVFCTTRSSEERALIKTNSMDFVALKKRFQNAFEHSFKNDSEGLLKKYGIVRFEALATNGINETRNLKDFSDSKNGGLKILFYESGAQNPSAFIWMRPSATENVFRIMCDVKGECVQKEKDLLAWEKKLLMSEMNE